MAPCKEELGRLACYHLAVKEWQDNVVFLHQVAAGAAHRSYGLHVAQLAGLPAAALSRAGQLLAALEAAPGHYPAQ
ncbi:MAG: MutS-related protein, partial [Holosporaceae bacterium]